MEKPTYREVLKDGNRLDPTGLFRISGLAVGALLIGGLKYFGKHPPDSIMYWWWFGASAVVLILFAISEFVINRRRDELERMVHYRAATVSFTVMICAAILLAMLELRLGYPIPVPTPIENKPDYFGLYDVAFAGLMSYVLAAAVYRRRLMPK